MTNEEIIFARLCQKYVQRADARQRSMGLQYMDAETHDLARFVADLVDDLDESCKHGFADWRNCATCTIREQMYAQGMSAGTAETLQAAQGDSPPARSRSDAPNHDILKGDAGQSNKRGATS